MEIRQATSEDIPAIVSLLKISLGESLMPKSETYWNWKHVNNPFGASPVLLASEGKTLIGVRAFMRWKWKNGSDIIEAVRAVDTATHPDFQGKGIFSKLTLSLLEYCKTSGIHIVFNTPNEKSKPGYLKMGWKEAGKLPVSLRIVNPVGMGINFLLKSRLDRPDNNKSDTLSYFLNHPGLLKLIDNPVQNLNYITAHTIESLRWRYEEVPVVTYYADGIENEGLNALIIFRIKNSRLGRELRITDVFSDTTSIGKNVLYPLIKKQLKLHKADYVTWSSLTGIPLKHGLTLSGRNMGPTVTIRNITMPSADSFYDFNAWRPSLGDLELF